MVLHGGRLWDVLPNLADGGKHWQKRFLDSLLFSDDQRLLERFKRERPTKGMKLKQPPFCRTLTVSRITDDGLNAGWRNGVNGSEALTMVITWQRIEEIYPGSFFAVAFR